MFNKDTRPMAYRYSDVQYASSIDEYESGTSRLEVILEEFPIIKETPKGFWIEYYLNDSNKKFIRNDARKQFAHRDTKSAKQSFIFRKHAQIRILSKQLGRAEKALNMMDNSFNAGFHAP